MTDRRIQAIAMTGVIACLVMMGGVLPAGSQEPTPPVFTARQADAGQAAYAQRCASCHMADLSGSNDVPPLAGEIFLSSWKTRTTKDLIEYMTAAMPPGGPALTAEGYASIAAYVLKSNGAGPGDQPLTSSMVATIGSIVRIRTVSSAAP